LNEESEIYKAHFPSDPITPGVCELIMIKEVLCTLYPDMNVALSSARQIKFIDVIRPTEVKSFFLELKHQLDEDNILVDARIFKEQTDFLKAKLNYLISA
jgi:3-hydroxyacyl-[acyl-carrier-protein] dehydratase